MGTPLVARSYRFLLVVSLCLGPEVSSVLRLLGLGSGGATLAHASLEAGHAGTGRIGRPGGRFGSCLLTTAATHRSWHEVSPGHPARQARLGRLARRGRRDRLGRAPALIGGRRPRRSPRPRAAAGPSRRPP